MFRWLALIALPLNLYSYVYLYTRMGDVFRSTDGKNFELVSNTGYTDGVSLLFEDDTLGYYLTRSGVILETNNRGEAWQRANALSLNDSVELIKGDTAFYLLTESGDFYRGNDVNSLTLVSNIGNGRFVSLTRDIQYLYALTESGEIYRSQNGDLWQLSGEAGSMGMVAIDALIDTLFAINYFGDLFKSVDHGHTWTMVSTISQMGTIDMMVTEDLLILATLETGEIIKRSGENWEWIGTASQSGVQGISTSGTTTFVDDRNKDSSKIRFRILRNIVRDILEVVSEKGKITIYTADGAIVKQMVKDRGYMAIDVSRLKSGIYFVGGFGRVYRVMVK